MQEINIAGLDLNLLPPLGALLRRRNVTRAAADVGLSQPAMSRALSRLRDLIGDPLLVRGGGGLQLTPRAAALLPKVEAALSDVRALFHEPAFDPAAERRVIRIAASDAQTVLLAPAIMARLAREAPGLSLRMESYGPDLVSRLERGDIDLAFALTSTPLPPGALSEPVSDDRLALVMRRGHPAADRDWVLADYAAYDHVVVALTGDGQSDTDALLAAGGVTRRIALVTPHFTAAVAAVAATDMITTISRRFARQLAPAFDLVLREPPFAATDLRMTLVRSQLRDRDAVLAWFRKLVVAVAADVFAA